MAPKAAPNGTVDAPIEVSNIPPVVGINFGNSYASIAVFTKEGLAESIANEDGERQIACAISFQGEEIYIGNPAKHQLVKNAHNTITGFRNLLGKKFSEIPKDQPTTSAPVIQHPDIPDEPAYCVKVLQAAPSPLSTSASNTPAPTPRSEPTPAERVLTVKEVTSLFLRSLVQSAEDFLGKKVQGAVISVPSWFSDAQKAALEAAATSAGVPILQLLDEAGAAAATTTTSLWAADLPADRTQLVVDLGASSLSLALLSIREGLAHILASSATPGIGGDAIDNKLVQFFAKDFTKKTKTPLAVAPASNPVDARAEAKLRLALEHTKRTLSASPGAASCSVESLKDGLDYTGAINRMRFDLEARAVYTAVSTAVAALLESAGRDAHDVDEVVYVGGSASLPGLDEALSLAFREDVATPFARGTVVGGGTGDPTTVLARGCALQAALIAGLPDDPQSAELRAAFHRGPEVRATAKTIGLLFPGAVEGDDADALGGAWVPLLARDTPLPARRTVALAAALGGAKGTVAVEVWEAREEVRVETIPPPPVEGSDEEEEPEEVKHRAVRKEALLGAVRLDAVLGASAKGSWTTRVEAKIVVAVDGALELTVREVGEGGAVGTLTLKAP